MSLSFHWAAKQTCFVQHVDFSVRLELVLFQLGKIISACLGDGKGDRAYLTHEAARVFLFHRSHPFFHFSHHFFSRFGLDDCASHFCFK